MFSQLDEHRIVEELADGDIFAEALAASCLYHELTSQMIDWLRLEWLDYDALVERIARNYLPVVKHGQAEGLTLGVRAQVGLETKRVYGWYERFECVQRRA